MIIKKSISQIYHAWKSALRFDIQLLYKIQIIDNKDDWIKE